MIVGGERGDTEMRDWMKRALLLVGVLAIMVLGVAGAAVAETSAGPSVALGEAAESLIEQLMDTAAAVLPYAATLVAVFIGWRILRRFLGTR